MQVCYRINRDICTIYFSEINMKFIVCFIVQKSFVYKGKTNKTCVNCLINKAKKQKKLNNDNTQPTMETISAQSLCDYIENLISNIENNNEISFEICIDLNDDIFSEVEPNDLKSIVRIIVNKVEESDDYV
ncbi:2149_t:CDS:2 [Dentiscutata heterogama]|uniref:2149_t:CDS:1 n=1 Tax=Dentiscutata heterogama TaxID=1316150 RepID=A0ACA9LBU7_9GLOM|nr:2149_t:CDS:2 [Dentiscutata heterogama]